MVLYYVVVFCCGGGGERRRRRKIIMMKIMEKKGGRVVGDTDIARTQLASVAYVGLILRTRQVVDSKILTPLFFVYPSSERNRDQTSAPTKVSRNIPAT